MSIPSLLAVVTVIASVPLVMPVHLSLMAYLFVSMSVASAAVVALRFILGGPMTTRFTGALPATPRYFWLRLFGTVAQIAFACVIVWMTCLGPHAKDYRTDEPLFKQPLLGNSSSPAEEDQAQHSGELP
ncbi:MAG: hypothetical protein GY851_08035 [bacterium]|nr:hypothetical protein [bacterium]